MQNVLCFKFNHQVFAITMASPLTSLTSIVKVSSDRQRELCCTTTLAHADYRQVPTATGYTITLTTVCEGMDGAVASTAAHATFAQ